MEIGGMIPAREGAGSHFAPEQSLVIFVMRRSALITMCNKWTVRWLCHSHWKHCVNQHFPMWPQRVSGQVIHLYGGISKSSSILSTRGMKAVT